MATVPLTKTLPRDSNKREIQVANSFQTSDATGTPLTSPQTVATGADTILVVPTGAVAIRLTTDQNLRISETADLSNAPYDMVLTNTTGKFGVAGMTSFFLRADSVAAAVKFSFDMLG